MRTQNPAPAISISVSATAAIAWRELNKRLKELFYLDGTAGNTYTEETAEAIKKFQSQAGLYITGNATPSVQQRLFTAGAPEYNG